MCPVMLPDEGCDVEIIELRASVELDPVPESVGAARRFVTSLCGAALVEDEQSATAALLTSELVTNAIKYGGSKAVLQAESPGGVLRVSVRDDNPDLPAAGVDPAVTDEGGRGMLLVEAMATRWGVETLTGGGKAVWFEIGA